MAIDLAQHQARVRIMNVKSGRYLSIEGDTSNWSKDDASLTIRDWLNLPTLESPQVWNINRCQDKSWMLTNQYSRNVACIRARSSDNGATAIQHHDQWLSFQRWNFQPLSNGNWLIQNVNSGKYIGPQNRSTDNDHYCIQWDNQTSEDNYQEWVLETV